VIRVCGKEIKVEGRLIRIACLEGDKYEFVNNPEAILEGLRKSAMRIDLFTFLQELPESLQALSEGVTRYRYPMEWDNLAVLPVSTFENWQMHQIRSEARNRTRQAGKKGVVVREVRFDDALVRGIWEIYNECPVRQGRPFSHYGKNIETVRKEEATYLDHSIFIGAYLGDKLIGFVKLVTDETRRQANLMNILSTIQHRDKAPTNALIAQAVKSCAEHSIAYLLYQNFSYGKKPRDGITKFKEVNGFQRVDLPRYYVPLTALGWAAFRLGLHHRWVEHLPEAIYTRLHELRNAWYSRKLQASTGIS
jgi:hypothetical protein